MGAGVTSGECSPQETHNISEEDVSDWLFTPVDTTIITIVLPIILSLGIINNTAFLYVVFRIPKMRSDTNLYLAALALADLVHVSMSSLCQITRYKASNVSNHWPFDNSADCLSFWTIINMCFFTSIALVTAVSYEKYLGLCHPMRHLKIRGRKRTCKIIAVCWLTGLVFSVPTGTILLGRHHVTCLQWPNDEKYQAFPSAYSNCNSLDPNVLYYAYPLTCIAWFVSMVANLYMYVKILRKLNKRKGLYSQGMQRVQKAIQIRNHVAKMLIVNGVVFFLCQTSSPVLAFIDWICILTNNPNHFRDATRTTQKWIVAIPELMNTIVNPLIYGVVNSQYRTAMVQAFHCCKDQVKRKEYFISQNNAGVANRGNATIQTRTHRGSCNNYPNNCLHETPI